LNLDVDLDLGGLGLGNLVGDLLNGVLTLVDNLLDGLLGGLSGILGGLTGSPTANIAVDSVHNLGNGLIRVNLVLQDSVQGGLTAELDVLLLNSIGVMLNVDTQTFTFSGVAGEIVPVDLDVSAAIGLLDCDSHIQVSIHAFILGIIDLDVNINVNLGGLSQLLDSILSILIPVGGLTCDGYSSMYTTDYSTNAYTTDYSTNAYTTDYSTNAYTTDYSTNAYTTDYSTNAYTTDYSTNAYTTDYSTNAYTTDYSTNAYTTDYSTNVNPYTTDFSTNYDSGAPK